jgi:hypothetical protein
MATTPRSPRVASPRTQAKRPGDRTGTLTQQLSKERDDAKLEAQKEVVDTAAAEKEARRNTVVDYSTGPVSETATEIEVEEPDEPISVPEVKDSYTKEEFEAALAAALAASKVTARNGDDFYKNVSTVDVDTDVEVRAKKEYIRVNFPIDDMTYGREVLDEGAQDETGAYTRAPRLGNLRILNFEEGVKYLVDSDVADHLRGLGYVYAY